MAAGRMFFGLLALAHFLVPAASSDDGSLVQSNVGLHRQEPQKAAAEDLVASCADFLLLEATPADKRKNSTKKLADSLVAAFRDEKFVRTANKAVSNLTEMWEFFTKVAKEDMRRLKITPANVSKEEAFQRIYRFWLAHGVDFSRALAAEFGARAVLNEALPEGYLRELHPPAKEGPETVYNMSVKYISQRIDDTVDGTLADISHSSSQLVCDRVGVLLTNLSAAYFTLPMALKAHERNLSAELQSAVMSYAPQEGPDLLKYLSKAFGLASDASLLFQDIVDNLKEANNKVLAQSFNCTKG